MALYRIGDESPRVASDAWVAESATSVIACLPTVVCSPVAVPARASA